MANTNETMLHLMVDLATKGGKMEAELEARDKEIERLIKENTELRSVVTRRDARISELEHLLTQQESARPQVVVNNYNFLMLSVPRTRAYVYNLSNDGRQFVGHMLHQTMLEDTPRSVMDQVDEMTRLRDYQEGGVVIQHNSGPVNGNIGTQNVGMPGMNDENSLNQLEQHG